MIASSKVMSLSLLIGVLCALVFLYGHTKGLPDRSSFVECELQGKTITVNLGRTHPPTFFVVVTPTNQLVQLINPSEKVDMLEGRYRTGRFALSIRGQKGVIIREDGRRSTGKVFVSPGRYLLKFGDANTIAGAELRAFSCEVTLSARHVTTATHLSMFYAVSASEAALMPVGCNYYPDCGGTGKSCCKKSSEGGACYCSICCVARPPGETRIASDASASSQECRAISKVDG